MASLVGHVLAEYPKEMKLDGKSVAAIADQVVPGLTAAMVLLKEQNPAEAGNFRSTVLVAVEAAARTHQGRPRTSLRKAVRAL
ncbi:hypothetical protein [Actinoallomurus rhizosphaericola]|uniref:hypothetical protein n=1 Tax=Actinoallomurus rhizosphaericola TaxID=2952536 RepID=UPI002091FE42|nr:hypothetical protein [Actinoallomurus rhizosphaericola]MCO6000354.1 hypothetical protein [Actinoallomurus rhizosphaericola]